MRSTVSNKNYLYICWHLRESEIQEQANMVSQISLYVAILITSVLLVVWMTHKRNRLVLHLPPSPLALPIIGHFHLIDTVPYRSLHKLSTRYGPFFHLRLGSKPCVVASSPQLAKELLVNNDLTFASRPTPMIVHHLTYKSSGMAVAPDGPHWKLMRKMCMSNLLGGRTLAQLQPIQNDEVCRLVQLFIHKSLSGETVNLSQELSKLSNNVITRMMLGISFSENHEQAAEACSLTSEVTQIFGTFNLSDYIGFLRHLDLQGLLKKSKDAHRRFDMLIEKIIKEREESRRKTTSGVKDFLDTLLDTYEDENAEPKLTRDDIKAFVLDMFTAGTDTTAAATEWAFSELINHPNAFQTAREEIDSVVGKNRLVGESDVPNLPYVQAVFKEALRLHPPVPTIGRKAGRDCKISGYDVLDGTSLMVNVWSIGRNPSYWEDPLEFKPERFMPSEDVSSIPDVKGQHYNLLPFGTGRRVCPGMSLASQQVPTVLAALIQCFDWNLVHHGGGVNTAMLDIDESPGLIVRRANSLMVVPIIRLNPFK